MCQRLPRLRGYLIAWVKVTAYRTTSSSTLLPTYVHSRSPVCAAPTGRGDRAIPGPTFPRNYLDNLFTGTPRAFRYVVASGRTFNVRCSTLASRKPRKARGIRVALAVPRGMITPCRSTRKFLETTCIRRDRGSRLHSYGDRGRKIDAENVGRTPATWNTNKVERKETETCNGRAAPSHPLLILWNRCWRSLEDGARCPLVIAPMRAIKRKVVLAARLGGLIVT